MSTKYVNFNNRSRADEIIVEFPGGTVAVTRRSDGLGYWAHITRARHMEGTNQPAVIVGRRIDTESKSVNEAELGDLAAADFYHVSVCFSDKERAEVQP